MHLFILAITLLLLPTTALADTSGSTQPVAVFSQEVLALNPDGTTRPAVPIRPEQIPGIQTRDFSLGQGQTLRIVTNVSNADGRGLDQVVATVRDAYNWVEGNTGRRLRKGVMLYLIEMNVVPLSFRFEAAYTEEVPWGEVRMALVHPGQPLTGSGSPRQLNELLYDTIPHELGHDILNDIPQLAQDLDNGHLTRTRWFAEGACEYLAKSFSHKYAPHLHQQYVSDRNLGRMLHHPEELNRLLHWGQHDGTDAITESDFYGGALLLVNAWSSATSLPHIIDSIAKAPTRIEGHGLLDMVKSTTGWESTDFVLHASGGRPQASTSQPTKKTVYKGG